MLQTVSSFSDLNNYSSDSNFLVADKLVRGERATELVNAHIIRAEKQMTSDGLNYRITYQSDSGTYVAVVYS
jgi:hypothetical protein